MRSRSKWDSKWAWKGGAFIPANRHRKKKKHTKGEKNKVLYFGSKQINNFYSLRETGACYKRPYSYKIPVASAAYGLLNWTHCDYTGNISHLGTVWQRLVYR